jgi:integrase
LLPEEIRFIWNAAREVGGDFFDVLRLLLLTGMRLRTVLHARAEEFDLDRALWTIPRDRMKAKRDQLVPLSDQAVSILEHRLKTAKPWIFPSPHKAKNKPLDSQGKARERIAQRADKLAKRELPGWTFHDMKRTLGTGLQEHLVPAVPREIVSLILAHGQSGPAATAVYARAEMLDERRAALQRWADWLKVTVSGLKEANVRA